MEEFKKTEGIGSGGVSEGDLVRSLVKDLAELAQAQASLTRDLVRLLDVLGSNRGPEAPGVQTPTAGAETPASTAVPAAVDEKRAPAVEPVTESAPQAATFRGAGGSRVAPESEPIEPEKLRIEPARFGRASVPAVESARETAPAPSPAAGRGRSSEQIEYTVTNEADPGRDSIAAARGDRGSAASFLEDRGPFADAHGDRGWIPAAHEARGATASAPATSESSDEMFDPSGEGPDDTEGGDGPDATVLVLESGDARVGVLWDQVAQVGSLTSPVVPQRIESERGPTDLVSLGLLLHGLSREEKYFVVLEQDGERAAVACERMLGLGPLNSASRDEGEARIQVLRVPLLKTFATGARDGPAKSAGQGPGTHASRPDDEERDRNGPLRALVAVRYLPARVAICRHLRSRGWQVGEAAGLEAANISLDLGRWDVLFLEVRSNGDPDDTEITILRRVGERGIPVIRVGSRLSGFSQQQGPGVMFPFAEAELDSILLQVGDRAGGK